MCESGFADAWGLLSVFLEHIALNEDQAATPNPIPDTCILLVGARTPSSIKTHRGGPAVRPGTKLRYISMSGTGAGVWTFSFGASAIEASVVRKRPATDAAFCRASRVTLVGSRIPISIRSPYSLVAAL